MDTPDITTPPLVSTPVRPKVPVIPMSYHGKAAEIFKLHIINLLLNIVTLGIYSFWGKTRIRRYMTSHITIAKDRFEYTGTGKELLVGWIKAMVIFLPLLVCMAIPGVNILAYPLFFGILSVAIYLALRYRLSRTRWRGIRFTLGGSIKEYLVLSLKRTFINIVTLGWKIPTGDIQRWSYIANHMSYGELKFSYQGDVKKLQKIHAITLVILILSFTLPLVGGGFAAGQALIEQAQKRKQEKLLQNTSAPSADMTSGQIVNPVPAASSADTRPDESKIAGLVGFMYLGFGIGMISRLWYAAALWHEKFRGLKLGNLRFKMDVSGGGLAKLFLINMGLIIITLGLAKPIAMHRTLRYFVQHFRIGGDINELIVEQSKVAPTSGAGDALAADVGFDLGL